MTGATRSHGRRRVVVSALASAVAVVAIGTLFVVFFALGSDDAARVVPARSTPACTPSDAATSAPTTAPTTASTSAIAPTTRTPTTTVPTSAPTTTVPTPPPMPTLRLGARGADVLALQVRLVALGFWLGEADGTFSEPTEHAVVAFQKASGLARDGVVGPQTRAALATAQRLAPRSTHGRVIEIDRTRQLLLTVVDGRVEWVFDTSTGRVAGTTPPGRWRIEREIDGYHRSRLGLLYRPKYFHGGVAIHGFSSVPPYPASHGCVRVINAVMDHLWSSGAAEIGTPVWVE
jgi:peptidoglycan hydrolase-like protein with peptidoglycan-binding domain